MVFVLNNMDWAPRPGKTMSRSGFGLSQLWAKNGKRLRSLEGAKRLRHGRGKFAPRIDIVVPGAGDDLVEDEVRDASGE